MAVEGFLENLRQGDVRGLGQNLWEGARDEWFGLDDFGRMLGYGMRGEFGKALKSLGAGVLELGGTGLMIVPGANIAALAAKGGKLGKVGKVLNLARPLRVDERAAAKELYRRGVKRSWLKQGMEGPTLQQIADVARKNSMFDEFGYGRGGILGSLGRGVGQIAGAFPASQGPLATGKFGAQSPFLSGKLGTLLGKAERDEFAQMLPFVGEPAVDPYKEALRALLEQYGSPGAAY